MLASASVQLTLAQQIKIRPAVHLAFDPSSKASLEGFIECAEEPHLTDA